MSESRFIGLKVGIICDRGVKREYNEDSTLVLRYDLGFEGAIGKIKRDGWILAVADGVGGREKGDVASRIALTTLSGQVMFSTVNTSFKTQNEFSEILSIAFSEANSSVINDSGGTDSQRPGTTLVVSYIVGSELYVGNVGDSRCYLLSKGKIKRITKDDSYVQQLIDSGEITEEEADTHPKRNEITNAIGVFPPNQFKSSVKYIGNIENYDYILLCSDGLHGVVKDNELASIIYKVKKVNHACRKLIELAKKRGGPDNITAVLAQVVVD